MKPKNAVNASSIVEPSGKLVSDLATQSTTPATSVKRPKSQQNIETAASPPDLIYKPSRQEKASVCSRLVIPNVNVPNR